MKSKTIWITVGVMVLILVIILIYRYSKSSNCRLSKVQGTTICSKFGKYYKLTGINNQETEITKAEYDSLIQIDNNKY